MLVQRWILTDAIIQSHNTPPPRLTVKWSFFSAELTTLESGRTSRYAPFIPSRMEGRQSLADRRTDTRWKLWKPPRLYERKFNGEIPLENMAR